MDYNKTKRVEETNNMIRNVKSRLQTHIHKYTNELVHVKNNIKKLIKHPETNNKTSMLGKLMKGLLNNRDDIIKDDYKTSSHSNQVKVNQDLLEESYITTTIDKKVETLSPEINYFGAEKKDKDMAIIYKRMNDIQKLELKHMKDMNIHNQVNNQEFNQIYYKFKKKL